MTPRLHTPILLWEGDLAEGHRHSVAGLTFRVVADAEPNNYFCGVCVERKTLDAFGAVSWVEVVDYSQCAPVLLWALDQIARQNGLIPPQGAE